MAKKSKAPNPAQITTLQAMVTDLDHKWKRALADYDNLQKRTQSQQTLLAKLASLTIIEKLLPILDDLRRAQEHLHDQGLELVIKQYQELLETEGVTPLLTQNQPFNPHTMECIEAVAGPKDQVIREILTGYTLGDTVIRPAKVEVGNGTSQ